MAGYSKVTMRELDMFAKEIPVWFLSVNMCEETLQEKERESRNKDVMRRGSFSGVKRSVKKERARKKRAKIKNPGVDQENPMQGGVQAERPLLKRKEEKVY
jgi:hypothetical protein